MLTLLLAARVLPRPPHPPPLLSPTIPPTSPHPPTIPTQLATQVQTLLAQLAARPKPGDVEALEKEARSLDLLLQGTQRENERAMAELERCVLCAWAACSTRGRRVLRVIVLLYARSFSTTRDLPSLRAIVLLRGARGW